MKRIKELQVNRFKMLTSWLTFTAFVAASVNPAAAAALTFAPSRLVTSPPEAELTLKCGDDKDEGKVQFWHTPFGDLQTPGPGIHGDLNLVFVHHDGSLVITNASVHHSGLYYCVLQHTAGAALWQYELHVGPGAGVRLRRDVGPLQEDAARVSDGTFAGAVAASVLLTFVCGFSAGALARSHVLRCLEAVTRRLRSPRQRRSDVPDHQSATMTTLPAMYDYESYETEQEMRDESMMTPSPPAKPRRSFKLNREEVVEEEERTAYLEGCDYRKEEEEEEEEAGRGVKEEKESSGEEEEEERESSGFYLLEDEGSQTETDEEKGGRESREETVEEEEEEERESREETVEEEEEERESREETVEEEEEEGRESREETVEEEEEEERESREDGGETSEENVEEKDGEPEMSRDSEQSSSDSEEEEEPPSSSSSSRRRVIRLYQYDEDGQRYSHLPDPVPADPGPAPRLKHRSLSLTRLSTIMAVASASPLDGGETGTEESVERPHFRMEI